MSKVPEDVKDKEKNVRKDEESQEKGLDKLKKVLKQADKKPSSELLSLAVRGEESELEAINRDADQLEAANQEVREELNGIHKELKEILDFEKEKELEALREIKNDLEEMSEGGGITEEKVTQVETRLKKSVEAMEKIVKVKIEIARDMKPLAKEELFEEEELKELKSNLEGLYKITELGEREGEKQHNQDFSRMEQHIEDLLEKEMKKIETLNEEWESNVEAFEEILNELERESKILGRELEAFISDDKGFIHLLNDAGLKTGRVENLSKAAEEIETKVTKLNNHIQNIDNHMP